MSPETSPNNFGMSPEKDPCSGELNVRNAHPTKNRGWPVHGGMHGRVPRKLPQLDDDETLVAIAAAASRDLATKATIDPWRTRHRRRKIHSLRTEAALPTGSQACLANGQFCRKEKWPEWKAWP